MVIVCEFHLKENLFLKKVYIIATLSTRGRCFHWEAWLVVFGGVGVSLAKTFSAYFPSILGVKKKSSKFFLGNIPGKTMNLHLNIPLQEKKIVKHVY